MSRTAQLAIKVVAASNVPKTDTFSKTDPFIKISVPGNPPQKTDAKDNTFNPEWNKSFAFRSVPIDPTTGLPSATVTFELWDEGSIKDTHMGTAIVPLAHNHFTRQGIPVEIPFTFVKSKWAQSQCYLRVAFSWFTSFDTLLAQHPQAFADRAEQRLYIPLSLGPLVLGIEYEKDALDIKLFVTQPSTGLHLDMVLATPTNHKTKLRRRDAKHGVAFYSNMLCYEELKLDNVPFWEDLSMLSVVIMNKKQEEVISLDNVVTRHGWKGAMNWALASQKLTGVELDMREQEIYMPMPGSFIVVDFDEGNVDMKCKILEIPENANNAFDLTLTGSDVKKSSEVYVPARPALGKYMVQRVLELDDVPYGTAFKDMVWCRYSLHPVWTGSLASLMALK